MTDTAKAQAPARKQPANGADRRVPGTGGRPPRGAASAVQSVDRAVTVLEILARLGEAGVTEIADELGVHKSTAFRLLGVLEHRGLVAQEQERGKYYLGAGVLRLAGAAAVRLDISQEGAAVCRTLADELGETVNIAVLESDAAVNIMQARGPASVTAQNWLGRRTPLHATSSGKALLAYQPRPVREAVLARKLPRLTERTVTSPGELRDQLAEVVERGFAVAVEELELGLRAVAAPVRAHDGSVIGAISVSVPAYRLDEERLPEVVERTVAAGEELSRRMGYAC
ncbi:IclR family transcriptional regulator [Streptomyces sp. RS10V-4]|uniref:IclR family transcriptional regulator n=1 Tax=Streptomyces rhizoryzae TaxID=2932493 RepID=UPI0020068201|nr:IclR family transcriptional regulator [Streptomyces rhizoryzae]MCK7625247.1 IclR family transcriptional regulator [Streptomyces rhizoryzae]